MWSLKQYRYPRRTIALIVFISASICTSLPSLSHTKISPENLILRNPSDGLKGSQGPCGGAAPAADTPRTTLTAGEDYEITWFETIDHPSKYRIAFSKDETDTFDVVLMDLDDFDDDTKDPTSLAEGEKQDKDGPVDRMDPRRYTYTIKVPNTPCDRCSLQLIQRMFDRTPPSDYYSCADIKIVPDGDTTGDPAVDDPKPTPPASPSGLKLKFNK